MPRQPRTLPLEIVRGHPVARFSHARALIDTGSPLTMRAPRIISEQLDTSIRWLVGTDMLRSRRVNLDWRNREVVVDAAPAHGERIDLIPFMGLYQIELQGDHGRAHAFLDTGAHLSYAPESAVRNLRPVARERDFYPLLGEFTVPVYELDVRVGRRRIRARFGVLPEVMTQLLAGVGGTGWILGSDFFRDRCIQLDFARDQVIDATPERQRVTVPLTIGSVVPEASDGIKAWRGWRLVDVAGESQLKSLTANDLWPGPVFTAGDMLADGRRPTGIHAYRTPLGLRSLQWSAAMVYGEVTLFGNVAVHELGYRAKHARVDRLYLRACGRHSAARPSHGGGGPLLLQLLAELEREQTYCGCEEMADHEWLTWDELERVAARLRETYQCEVTIDPERVRVPVRACRHTAGLDPRQARRY